ncbi:MAG: hypothetical protein Q4F95_14445 [Oscillospiraceae bacterium]|nr:hypothetical protein [Oscillospiraceae bacterium]
MFYCDTCGDLELSTAVSTLASVIASALDDDELALAAAVFTQLGDTLDTLSVRRAICSKKCCPQNE